MFKRHNEYLARKAKSEYKETIKNIIYWDGIEQMFAKCKLKQFTYSFKHPDYDDELKIECIAKMYGYKIVGEHLYNNKSVYSFEKV